MSEKNRKMEERHQKAKTKALYICMELHKNHYKSTNNKHWLINTG